jgi:hypothetical protein
MNALLSVLVSTMLPRIFWFFDAGKHLMVQDVMPSMLRRLRRVLNVIRSFQVLIFLSFSLGIRLHHWLKMAFDILL